MMWKLLMVIALGKLASSIKVPIDNLEETVKDPASIDSVERFNSKPIFYPSDENPRNVYPKISNSHKSEGIREAVEAPVTFLLPPSAQSLMYYKTPEQVEQSDWYPIAPAPAQNLPHQPYTPKSPELLDIVIGNLRSGKVLQKDVLPSTPSRILLPPLENAPNYYFADHSSIGVGLQSKFNQPTILYPKKVVSGYKPVPIPIAQFADNLTEIPKAKPVIPIRPQPSIDGVFITPLDEKKTYLYKQAEQKRQLKKEHQDQNQYILPSENTYNTGKKLAPSEQETSESIQDHPEDGLYPAPVKQNIKRPVYVPENKGERTEFRMHGMNGPHSYQFGYDTGKGKNRQFRYEERDNDGHVRGHYGYMDKQGKLRVVKYDADPKLGFRADPPVVQE